MISGGAVRSRQLLLLSPDGPAAHEHIHRSLEIVKPHSLLVGADDRRVPIDRHRPAKLVKRRGVGCHQLLLLSPDTPAAHEHVRRALLSVWANSMMVCADD